MVLQVLNPEIPENPTAQRTVRNAGKGSSEKSGGLYGPYPFQCFPYLIHSKYSIWGTPITSAVNKLGGHAVQERAVSRIELHLQPKTVLASLPSKPDKKHDKMS